MLTITDQVTIPHYEIKLSAIRARGAGGQNVNKVASAVHLRFAIATSSLPSVYKQRLLALRDRRIGKEGVVVIKADNQRTQEKNREEALDRLRRLILSVTVNIKKRRPTKPTFGSRIKRLDNKSRHGRKKALRGRVTSS